MIIESDMLERVPSNVNSVSIKFIINFILMGNFDLRLSHRLICVSFLSFFERFKIIYCYKILSLAK